MIDYSIINDEKTDYVAVRSTVKSFGLDHVTDKDITSFFSSLSKYAHIDTGLLPLDGTGLLAYRQAANHAQIVIQHAPGIYRIMWGSHEGDSSAKHYFLAQPYRIVIGDIVDGSLLGARMFYSPVPITNPSNQLYHVNLPNINCRGYRKNGVGWVCLYHNEDWSSLPIGERVSRLMERCSGAEAYNDANMSETDGPRFYAKHQKPIYTISPEEWENKTTQEGFEWTLDPDLWIPVLVLDRDNQAEHCDSGQPLTLGMALTGDYRAYYTDDMVPKPVNAIAREDKEYPHKQAFAIVKKAYLEASTNPETIEKLDPYSHVMSVRSQYSLTFKTNPVNEVEDPDTCSSCEEEYEHGSLVSINDETFVCNSCLEEYYCYIEKEEQYYPREDCTYIDSQGAWFLSDDDDLEQCSWCGHDHHKDDNAIIYPIENIHSTKCIECIDSDYIHDCSACSANVVVYPDYKMTGTSFATLSNTEFNELGEQIISTEFKYYCNDCKSSVVVCPCGYIRSSSVFDHFEASSWDLIPLSDGGTCCKDCAIVKEDNTISYNAPIQNDEVAVALNSIKLHNSIVEISKNNNIKGIKNDDTPF